MWNKPIFWLPAIIFYLILPMNRQIKLFFLWVIIFSTAQKQLSSQHKSLNEQPNIVRFISKYEYVRLAAVTVNPLTEETENVCTQKLVSLDCVKVAGTDWTNLFCGALGDTSLLALCYSDVRVNFSCPVAETQKHKSTATKSLEFLRMFIARSVPSPWHASHSRSPI